MACCFTFNLVLVQDIPFIIHMHVIPPATRADQQEDQHNSDSQKSFSEPSHGRVRIYTHQCNPFFLQHDYQQTRGYNCLTSYTTSTFLCPRMLNIVLSKTTELQLTVYT